MANENDTFPEPEGNAGESHGSDAANAASEPPAPEATDANGDAETLTVEDILEAEQSDEAAEADAGAEANANADDAAPVDPLQDQANPYLEDLRRLTAEYANYRKRTESNLERDRQRATAAAVSPLISVLDDLDRAEQHGDLEEGTAFATIAQKLRASLEKLGLESFGEKGEAFDPQIHEAIAQVPVPGAEGETVLDVIERGYRIGDVELRPAKVAVQVAADG